MSHVVGSLSIIFSRMLGALYQVRLTLGSVVSPVVDIRRLVCDRDIGSEVIAVTGTGLVFFNVVGRSLLDLEQVRVAKTSGTFTFTDFGVQDAEGNRITLSSFGASSDCWAGCYFGSGGGQLWRIPLRLRQGWSFFVYVDALSVAGNLEMSYVVERYVA